ncbi:MAG: DUF479 domain-containing protein [Bacteroidales bacterium]|nr:DUF479 domain-containing protein [Bacteroidales bacterium]
MNFLAHTYLSGENKKVALGNLIGDMVKGNAYENYEKDIKTGLILHRAIDSFTDSHEVFIHSKNLVTPYFKRYSGIVTDIYFDHFLAKHWNKYCDKDLQQFVNEIYILLIKKYTQLPPRAQRITPFLIIRNWMGNYGHLQPLHHVFLGMHRRTQKLGNMHQAVEILQQHYDEIEKDFHIFFEDVRVFSQEKLAELTAIQN